MSAPSGYRGDMAVKRVSRTEAMKAFTNPLRLRLFYALAARGSANATQLAADIGTTPQLAYYHLTRLSEYGFVEQDQDNPGKGRERNWRHSGIGASYDPAEHPGDPEAQHTAELMIRAQAAVHFRQLEEFLAGKGDPELRLEAFSADMIFWLSPDEMRMLRSELLDVLLRWKERTSTMPAADQHQDGTQRSLAMVFLHGFPFAP